MQFFLNSNNSVFVLSMSGRYFGSEQVDNFNFLCMNIMYNCFKLSSTYLDIQIILLVVKIENARSKIIKRYIADVYNV